MNRSIKLLVLPVVAILSGVMGLVLGVHYEKFAPEENVTVLVATDDIPALTRIEDPSKMFDKKAVPRVKAPIGRFVNFEELKYRKLLYPLEKGQPVLKGNVVGSIWRETRAVAICLVGFDHGIVMPGSRVDIFHSIRAQDGKLGQAKVLLENVLVLCVTTADENDVRSRPGFIIVLEVTIEQAILLAAAKDAGSVTCIGRPFGDNSVIDP